MIYANQSSLAFWKRLEPQKRARSLASTHFIDFPNDSNDKEWRKRTSEALCFGATKPAEKLAAWRSFALAFAENDLNSEKLLFARLQSRLMVNMAGGVFENGGLCLDRTSGVAFIPGSAVKGCARRAALAALREWSETDQKPSDEDNPLATAVEIFDSREALLEAIALTFGWGDQEWKNDSDFAWAWGCDEKPTDEQEAVWKAGRRVVASALFNHLGITLNQSDVQNPWKKLPNFAGTIAFLPAYPWNTDPKIELDVVTGHHRAYYESTAPDAVATDTEEPVPVIFPAVKPGDDWIFLVLPHRHAQSEHLRQSRAWLACGLSTFGVGAKTNAGYGWFDASDELNSRVRHNLAEASRRAQEDAQRVLEKQRLKEEEDRKKAAKDDLAVTLAGLTPDQQEDKKVSMLSEAQFDTRVRNFCKAKVGPSDAEKNAIVRALRGLRLDYWQQFKTKATKGDLATVFEAIRKLSVDTKLGKMP